jgi:putative tricarboxylic transport membrane protein
VLGDLLEKNLTRGLVLSGGSIAPFFTRPVSGALAAVTIFSVLWSIPGFSTRVAGIFRRRSPGGAAT